MCDVRWKLYRKYEMVASNHSNSGSQDQLALSHRVQIYLYRCLCFCFPLLTLPDCIDIRYSVVLCRGRIYCYVHSISYFLHILCVRSCICNHGLRLLFLSIFACKLSRKQCHQIFLQCYFPVVAKSTFLYSWF